MRTFFAADHHFGHAGILKMRGLDGELLRPGFTDLNDMHHCIISRHNLTVTSDDDTVYFVGDVVFDHRLLAFLLPQMRGKKKLIMGNHDKLKISQYAAHFKSLRGSKEFGKITVCHYPIHPMSFEAPDNVRLCVHGHTHEKKVWMKKFDSYGDYDMVPDSRYLSVCVERTHYHPVSLEAIQEYADGL